MVNEKALRASIAKFNKYKNSKSINVLFFILPNIFILYCIWPTKGIDWSELTEDEIRMGIIIVIIVSIVLGMFSILIMHCYCDYKINISSSRLISLGIEDAKEDVDNDIYDNLIKISYKYLDEYYLQTRQQAQKGFVVTVLVSIMGAVIIAIGIGTMFLGKTTPAYVTTASGIITEFIAAVFFYLYNKTISSMSDYVYGKPSVLL